MTLQSAAGTCRRDISGSPRWTLGNLVSAATRGRRCVRPSRPGVGAEEGRPPFQAGSRHREPRRESGRRLGGLAPPPARFIHLLALPAPPCAAKRRPRAVSCSKRGDSCAAGGRLRAPARRLVIPRAGPAPGLRVGRAARTAADGPPDGQPYTESLFSTGGGARADIRMVTSWAATRSSHMRQRCMAVRARSSSPQPVSIGSAAGRPGWALTRQD